MPERVMTMRISGTLPSSITDATTITDTSTQNDSPVEALSFIERYRQIAAQSETEAAKARQVALDEHDAFKLDAMKEFYKIISEALSKSKSGGFMPKVHEKEDLDKLPNYLAYRLLAFASTQEEIDRIMEILGKVPGEVAAE
ncbi:hypothetical protein LJC55_03400 [Eubacteriales bacterium OttesenSCG-928-N14]|nr:hypothetical protein [Eubacteriales bacterium OttesenSCG-928-N14]